MEGKGEPEKPQFVSSRPPVLVSFDSLNKTPEPPPQKKVCVCVCVCMCVFVHARAHTCVLLVYEQFQMAVMTLICPL